MKTDNKINVLANSSNPRQENPCSRRKEGWVLSFIDRHLEYGETIEQTCIRKIREKCEDKVNLNFIRFYL